MDALIQTLKNVTEGIQPVAIIVAVLALVIIGILWSFAKDPQKKEQYTSWMVNVAIGFAIVWLATSLMDWLSNQIVSTSIIGVEQLLLFM